MRLVVCIKQVPDPCSKVGMREDGTIDRACAPPILNPFDKHALEMALQLKEKVKGATVTVLSMGPPGADSAIRECIGMGADGGVLLTDKRLAASDTLATAYALSCCFKLPELKAPSLVFCGMQSTDGDTAHIGPQLAERLGMPQATYVERLDIKGGRATCRRIIEGGTETLEFPLHAVISVAPTANVPRAPSLKASIKAKSAKVKVIGCDEAGIDLGRVGMKGSPTWVAKIHKVEPPHRAGKKLEGAEELASVLRNLVSGDGGACK